MFHKNKKGEIESAQIISIIILVISVAIIFYIYFQINWNDEIDSTVCHQSVILRGTVSNVVNVGEVQNVIPLKCKTNKICVGGDGVDCKEEYSKAKDVFRVKVEDVNDINRLVAQEMISCWQMMGEGKISLFSRGAVGQVTGGDVYSGCVICSRLAFDEISLKEAGVDLNKIDPVRYMRDYKMPGENMSYYDYFAGENGKIDVKQDFTDVPMPVLLDSDGKPKETKFYLSVQEIGEDVNVENVDDESAIIFMQISAPQHGSTLKNAVVAMGITWGVGFRFNPIKTLSMTGKVVSNPFALATILALVGVQQLNVWANRNVVAGYCSDVSFGTEAREGCSVVRVVKYNLADLNKYCGVIESVV